MILLDSDVMIDILRKYPPAMVWFNTLNEKEEIALPGYVMMELIQGCRNKAEQKRLQRIVDPYGVNGTEALAAFRSNPNRFDLVVTDMAMPKMTGVQLATRLLEIKPDIPIILCTGFSDLIDEKQAQTVGIRQYLTKPIRAKELLGALGKVLKKKGD